MGRAVSEWAFADEELFKIFRDCIGPYEQSAIIYYKIQSLDTRMSLTDDIIRSILPKTKNGEQDAPSLIAWKAIKKAFTALLRQRSLVAHQQIHVQILASELDDRGDPTPTAKFETALELFPNAHERLKETGSTFSADYPKSGFSIDDLKAHAEAVKEVASDLDNFRNECDSSCRTADAPASIIAGVTSISCTGAPAGASMAPTLESLSFRFCSLKCIVPPVGRGDHAP
eukprot:gene50706-67883_t